MWDQLTAALKWVDDQVWGIPLIVLILAVGIYLTIRVRCLQLRHLPRALKFMVKNEEGGTGEVSSFGALCTALSATIGTGNIAVSYTHLETVLDTVGFDELLDGADVVFTGEGKIDSQSLRGKVVIGVAKRAGRKNVPVVVVAGGAEEGIDRAYDMGVTAVFSINRLPQDFSVSREYSRENMAFAMENILRLWKAAR